MCAVGLRCGLCVGAHIRHYERLAAAPFDIAFSPTVSLSMRILQSRGVDLWNAGATVVLAIDCDPGTSYVENMEMVVAMVTLEMRLTRRC